MVGGDFAIPTPWMTVKREARQFHFDDDRVDDYALIRRSAGAARPVSGPLSVASAEVRQITRQGSRFVGFAPDRGLTKTFLGRAGYTIDTNRICVRSRGAPERRWELDQDSNIPRLLVSIGAPPLT